MKENKTGLSGPAAGRAAVTGPAAAFALLAVMMGGHLALQAQTASTKNSSSTNNNLNIQVSPGVGGNTKINVPPSNGKGTKTIVPGIFIPPPTVIGHPAPAEHALCSILPGGCKAPDPQITGVFPFSNLTPGGYVLILGKNFNSLNGPGGRLQFSVGGTVHDLTELNWSDTTIGGRVPDGWNWPDPMDVDLWLVRSDGVKSNSLVPQPRFSPAYEVQVLPGTDLTTMHCGGADRDFCVYNEAGYTLDVSHATTYGHDSGTDYYKIAGLRNGWKTYYLEFKHTDNHGTVQPPSGFLVDYDTMDIQVHWDQDGGSLIGGSTATTNYTVQVLIRGPKGYSWK
jgi:hypothetical protein